MITNPPRRASADDTKPVCPACKNADTERINYLEEVTANRAVIGFIGKVLIVSDAENFDVYDTDSRDVRLICLECTEEFELPSKMELEFGTDCS